MSLTNVLLREIVLSRPDDLIFYFKTENWLYDFSIFFDPFADLPPAVPFFDESKNYTSRGIVSSSVCKLIDSWLDNVYKETIGYADKAYDDTN
jgi:hypothetical protein